mmetsp:Transcript_127705/g.285609  ORF Transcript_127705/g.285609 Transcript_127705/m.285609 type:complete len:369 (-) Transcript_127705:269-1375(-)
MRRTCGPRPPGRRLWRATRQPTGLGTPRGALLHGLGSWLQKDGSTSSSGVLGDPANGVGELRRGGVPDLDSNNAVLQLERRRHLLDDLACLQDHHLRAAEVLRGSDHGVGPCDLPLLRSEVPRPGSHRHRGCLRHRLRRDRRRRMAVTMWWPIAGYVVLRIQRRRSVRRVPGKRRTIGPRRPAVECRVCTGLVARQARWVAVRTHGALRRGPGLGAEVPPGVHDHATAALPALRRGFVRSGLRMVGIAQVLHVRSQNRLPIRRLAAAHTVAVGHFLQCLPRDLAPVPATLLLTPPVATALAAPAPVLTAVPQRRRRGLVNRRGGSLDTLLPALGTLATLATPLARLAPGGPLPRITHSTEQQGLTLRL